MNKEIIIFEKRAYMNFDLNYKGLSVTVTSKVEKLDASNAPDLKSQLLHLSKTNQKPKKQCFVIAFAACQWKCLQNLAKMLSF